MPIYQNLGVDLLLDDMGDLVIGSTGDLALTPDGRTTLKQDVKNLLDTLPGDLFGHPSFGAGLPRLLGEEDRPDFVQLITRAIADALTYDPSVAPRIVPDSIEIKPVKQGRETRFTISFKPLGEGWTSKMNLVWAANTGTGDV